MQQQWIQIPGGKFVYQVRHRIMEGDCQCEHGPVLVHLPAFEMTRYPVTNGMYRGFIKATGYSGGGNFLQHWRNNHQAGDDLPVVWASLKDARAYAEWVGGRLPTEAEWQYAAGGADGRSWPWGGDFDAARVNGKGGVLMPVDAHPDGESPFGIADMCGNAWEWTESETDDGLHRFALLRGGSCYRGPHFWHMDGGAQPIHSHVKMQLLADNLDRSGMVGFRLVRG